MRKLRWWIAGLAVLILFALALATRKSSDELKELLPYTFILDTRCQSAKERGYPEGPDRPVGLETRIFYVKGIKKEELLRILKAYVKRHPGWYERPVLPNPYFEQLFVAVNEHPGYSRLEATPGKATIWSFDPLPTKPDFTVIQQRPLSDWDVKMMKLMHLGRDPFGTATRTYPNPSR